MKTPPLVGGGAGVQWVVSNCEKLCISSACPGGRGISHSLLLLTTSVLNTSVCGTSLSSNSPCIFSPQSAACKAGGGDSN